MSPPALQAIISTDQEENNDSDIEEREKGEEYEEELMVDEVWEAVTAGGAEIALLGSASKEKQGIVDKEKRRGRGRPRKSSVPHWNDMDSFHRYILLGVHQCLAHTVAVQYVEVHGS